MSKPTNGRRVEEKEVTVPLDRLGAIRRISFPATSLPHRIHRPQAMSKPTNGRRVEWLPDVDSNHD